jgi:protocatechuate 3,4-dioxygenase beta subunit
MLRAALWSPIAAFLAACGGSAPPIATTAPARPSATIGAAAAPAQAGQAAVPSCVLTPALTEGPYFVDEKLNRADIRGDPSSGAVKEGLPVTLTLRVLGLSGSACAPVAGAQVDVWHCDASGVYSDTQDPGFGSTRGQKFLRGYQVTDATGTVKFTTIYPGWYRGRATHIHFKIRTDPSSARGRELTSQLFIDDALNSQIYTSVAPYSTRGDKGRTTNAQDSIFREGSGQPLIQLTRSGDGYAGTFDLGIKLA